MTTVALVGTGLVGGSLGLALRATGIKVVGYDLDARRLRRAAERGAVDLEASSLEAAFAGADAAFVAVPVSAVAPAVAVALDAGVAAVSDVGSVKAPVVDAVEAAGGAAAARFVGGHPMAGPSRGRAAPGDAASDGIEGAEPDMFRGATWVLTPTERTDPGAFAAVRELVASVGAEVVAVDPRLHDDLVATVSHLPHLAAATVMHVAADASSNRDTLLRLAAGGFRALTRLSGRAPEIWPDICVENRDAIVDVLDRYLEALHRARDLVSSGERGALLDFFERARAGSSLPARTGVVGPLVELAMPVPDRPGVLAEVTTLAGHNGINIVDLEITHSAQEGTLVMVVPADGADLIMEELVRLHYRVSRKDLG